MKDYPHRYVDVPLNAMLLTGEGPRRRATPRMVYRMLIDEHDAHQRDLKRIYREMIETWRHMSEEERKDAYYRPPIDISWLFELYGIERLPYKRK